MLYDRGFSYAHAFRKQHHLPCIASVSSTNEDLAKYLSWNTGNAISDEINWRVFLYVHRFVITLWFSEMNVYLSDDLLRWNILWCLDVYRISHIYPLMAAVDKKRVEEITPRVFTSPRTSVCAFLDVRGMRLWHTEISSETWIVELRNIWVTWENTVKSHKHFPSNAKNPVTEGDWSWKWLYQSL